MDSQPVPEPVRMNVNFSFPPVRSHYLPGLHFGKVTKFSANCIVHKIVADLKQNTVVEWYTVDIHSLLHLETGNLLVEIEILRHGVQNIAYSASRFPLQPQKQFV